MTPTLPNPANRAENLTRLCSATNWPGLGGGWCRLELSGLAKRRSSFWRKSSKRKVSGDSGGSSFAHFLSFLTRTHRFCEKAVYASRVSTMMRQSQPPGRLKEGRVRKPSGGGLGVTHCCKGPYVSSATFRRREHLSGYRSRQARMELPVLGWKLSERAQNSY